MDLTFITATYVDTMFTGGMLPMLSAGWGCLIFGLWMGYAGDLKESSWQPKEVDLSWEDMVELYGNGPFYVPEDMLFWEEMDVEAVILDDEDTPLILTRDTVKESVRLDTKAERLELAANTLRQRAALARLFELLEKDDSVVDDDPSDPIRYWKLEDEINQVNASRR